MNQTTINSGIGRATAGFAILILITCVFTFIVGRGGEGATSSGQAALLEPGTDDVVYRPGIADVAFVDSSYAWAINQAGTTLYQIDKGTSPRKQATKLGRRPLLSFIIPKKGLRF